METTKEVKAVRVDYKCPNCQQGYLRPTGTVYTTYPPQIPHKCTHCDYGETFSDKRYPYIDYVEIDKAEIEYRQSMFRTNNYVFRKHKLGDATNFDIFQNNLDYVDCSPTHHGLQCNHIGGTPEYEEIMKLCDQAVEIIKRIDKLNTLKDEEKV